MLFVMSFFGEGDISSIGTAEGAMAEVIWGKWPCGVRSTSR